MRSSTILMSAILAAIVSGNAHATLIGVKFGTASPPPLIGSLIMVPFPLNPLPAGGAPATFVPSPLGGSVGLPAGSTHSRIGAGWSTWSHGYMGDVYFNGGASTTLLTMPLFTQGFYFYVQGHNPTLENYTVTATNSFGESATVDLTGVSGQGGAAGVGFAHTVFSGGILTILITNTTGGAGGFAVGEFGIGLPPAPGALSLIAVAGLWSHRRRA